MKMNFGSPCFHSSLRNWLAVLCSGLWLAVVLAARAQPSIPADYLTGGFAIGCQSYTFKDFTLFEAIEKADQTGGKVIELAIRHKLSKDEPGVIFNHTSPDDVLAKVKAKLAQHKLKAVNYGVIAIPADEAAARKIFDFAKKMGLRALTTESTESIDTIEKLVKEYDIAVGYHNHPKRENNPKYQVWDPNYLAGFFKGRDPRIGAAADTGHWIRSNLKPVDCLRILKGRIISAHLKDLDKVGMDAHDVPYGQGVGDIKGCLDELKAQGFQGNIAIEYEYNWDNNVPDVKKCIDFVRNYGRGK